VVSPIIEIEKINDIAVGNPVINISQSTGEDKCKGQFFGESGGGHNEIDKDGNDEQREKDKNILGILMLIEKPKYTSEVSRMDNGKKGCDPDTFKHDEVLDDQYLCEPVEKKDKNYESKESVFSHRLHT
jgi:hypothetical protein